MPLATAEVPPPTPEEVDVQDILGGSCPILPMQCCILWSARQEKIISPLAFKVYFAAHEVKFWRCKTKPGETYHYEPYTFQLSDVGRILPAVPAAKIAKAFGELEVRHLLTLSNSGIGFANGLGEVTLDERVKHRAQTMFNQLHQDTRNQLVKIPRRILKLIVQCGRRIVRAATLIGMLLTTMLTKRTTQYKGYKGCVKAKWIATLFSVNVKRVNLERACLIAEGWFSRLPTPQRVRNRWGEWVILNLRPSQSAEPVENPTTHVPKVQPLNPEFEPEVQPLNNQSLSSPEEIKNNQILPPKNPEPGAFQPAHFEPPTWANIQLKDLHQDTRSETLWHNAIQHGHLKNTPSDRITFFAAIAHALRVAQTNPCGLLRTIVEKGLWHVITQADEYNAIQRLKRLSQAQDTKPAPPMAPHPFLATKAHAIAPTDEPSIELSKDALIVQTLTADLQRARVSGDLLPTAQRHGYLRDWDPNRWLKAEEELAQARLLRRRQQSQPMTIVSITVEAEHSPYPTTDLISEVPIRDETGPGMSTWVSPRAEKVDLTNAKGQDTPIPSLPPSGYHPIVQ